MPVIRAILFSIGIHFLLLTAVNYLAPLLSAPPVTPPIEVSLVTPQKPVAKLKNKNDYSVNPMAPEQLKAADDETLAKLLSDRKQRVKQEMVAREFGKNQNRSLNAGSAPQQPREQKQEGSTRSKVAKGDGYRVFNPGQELQDNQFEQGVSSFGGMISNDIRTGTFTALNADRHVYHSFYSRLYDLVSYRYDRTMDAAFSHMNPTRFAGMSDKIWITEAEFVLDENGVLKKSIILKESGVPEFDKAAIQAFVDARVFPNPPKEMVEDDGFIHIRFSFGVRVNPPTLVNRN